MSDLSFSCTVADLADLVQDMDLVAYATPSPGRYDLNFVQYARCPLPTAMRNAVLEEISSPKAVVFAVVCDRTEEDGRMVSMTVLVPPSEGTIGVEA